MPSSDAQPARARPGTGVVRIAVSDLFDAAQTARKEPLLTIDGCARSRHTGDAGADVVIDRFVAAGASCAFLRIPISEPVSVRIALRGGYAMASCPSGGWLLEPANKAQATYWIPRPPVLRRIDPQLRILSEGSAPIVAFAASAEETTIDVAAGDGHVLDCVAWHLSPELAEEIERPLVLELQPLFMLASHTSLCRPADLYAYLVHGQVYENRFDWVRKRKICSELEAYALYLAAHGLETATGKTLYGLLKLQLLLSVVARQAQDGGWYHGEWTDFMEAHYRFHNAAMLVLEASLEEKRSDVARDALQKAASVLSRCTDRTDLGLWFFHDSLEQSVEATQKSGIRWEPSRELGKAPATKLILNSHVDAIVALDRFREVMGEDRYAEQVGSALDATRKLLSLRPAQWLYRPLYSAVAMTLLPAADAQRLSLPMRAVKRFTRSSIIPRLYRIKRRFPRIVMPGGLIERHVSRMHFGVNYHSVNVMDLARLWRRFPDPQIAKVIDDAVGAVTRTSLMTYWVESGQRQAVGYWVEALFHICALRTDPAHRDDLARAMICAVDAGLGLPPSLLGAHPEIVKPAERFPCPSPRDPCLRVANLSVAGRREILVVNPTDKAREIAWEDGSAATEWSYGDDARASAPAPPRVPARGWLRAHGR